MRDIDIGRLVRALRRRKAWRQEDAAAGAGLHRSTWSLLERGHLDEISLPMLRRCLAVLEIRTEILVRWRGAGQDRLVDEDHSRLHASWKGLLERWGWEVVAEASFNHW
jgi:transcriptional regulator with XRE-family HTH domain